MTSTYDFAEPGFVLIDRVNELNNNWFDENIRATNPCVTADTWVQTDQGPRSVSELTGSPFNAVVNGMTWRSTSEGFFSTGIKPVVRLRTTDGFEVKLTRNHRVQRVARFADGQMETDWCEAGSLRSGDRVVLNDHRSRVEWAGKYGSDEGYLAGVLVASGGSVSEVDAGIAIYREPVAANAPYTPIPAETKAVMSTAMSAARRLGQVSRNGWESGLYGREYHLSVPCIGQVARELRLVSSPDPVTAEMERTSSEFHSGFLRAWFDLCGRVIAVGGRPEIDLAVPESMPDSRATLRTLQRMLLRLGVVSHIRRESEPSGWRLVVDATALSQFADVIGFSSQERRQQLAHAMSSSEFSVAEPRYVSQVGSISACGVEEVYDCQIPGVNAFDANGVMAHNCGEQPLPPYGSCLLGSINLTRFVHAPFSDAAEFDWDQFREVVKVFTRMLDNVVEINGLPLAGQRSEITRKRRHGMGFLGLGSTLALLCMRYGSKVSVEFTERVARELAIAGWETALELAGEKGAAPIMHEEFDVTPAMLRQRPEMVRDGYQVGDRVPGRILHAHYSRYMQRVAAVAPDLVERLAENGGRFTHHSSIAPTGTISLSLANNASNGIEPSFAHHYFRNVIREGRKTKEKVGVFSFELLAYRQLVNEACMPESDLPEESLPDYFAAADDIKPREHVDIQAAAQKWVDSSISKTANVPTEFPYEEFKDIYLYAYEQGLKGCTTFRFNPEAFQGVLVKEQDLKNTKYTFQLDNGEEVTLTGDEEVEYDGEVHTAANLFDALKEGYYGKF
jgi:ribonucleoside-diphosphate reductase alpha chain